MTFVAMFVGAFYVFAGVVVMRSMAMERLMDQVLAALNDPTDATDQMRVAVLSAGAVLTLASGTALAILSPLALPLFAANVAVQGAYLLWATRALPPEDALAATGRARTRNAFVIYCVATAFVIWLSSQGHLRSWSAGLSDLLIDAGIVVAAVLGVWAFIHMPRKGDATLRVGEDRDEGDRSATPLADYTPPPKPTHLRFSPEFACHPLWNDETGDSVNPFSIDLPIDLAFRIEDWDDLFQKTFELDDPASSKFASDAARDAYMEEGRAILVELRKVWPGKVTSVPEFE
jgi:hypothetical protein